MNIHCLNTILDLPMQPRKKHHQTIAFLEDRIEGNKRYLKIRITPNRTVNRYDIFANEKWLSTILLLMVRLH
jgi:hypothetical protein